PDGDGIWSTVMQLAQGKYEYKFVVNGDKWYEDPNAADFVPDPYGGRNSIVYVGGAVRGEAGLKFDGWLESKIEKVGDNAPNMYNDVYLKFSGAMRAGLETFTELHAWKTLHLGSISGWKSLLPLPVDGIEVNQAIVTLRLADGLATKLYYKGHAGNTGDHLVLIKSDGDEDRIWDRKAAELVYSKAHVDGRFGVASLGGGTTLVYGEVQGEVARGLTIGGLFTYETWPTDSRDDGEDHRTNVGGYATAKLDDYTTFRGEVIQTRGTKMISDSTVPVAVEFVYPKERESSGATAMYVRGSFQGWDEADMVPMTKDAEGNWRVTVELLEGEYEYKFWYADPQGNPSWGH
ncbi:MAG: glycogen-binding domain-containing protein, partial [Bacillota bacterium]